MSTRVFAFLGCGVALAACTSGPLRDSEPAVKRGPGDPLSVDATPQTIFGDLLVEDWDSRTGTTIADGKLTSFRGQVRGTTLTPVDPALVPALGPDASLFRGQPVVQCAGGSQLQVVLPEPIVAAGTRPYFAFVGRLRATRTDENGAGLVAFNHVFVGPQADSGTQIRIHEDGTFAAYLRWQGLSPEVMSHRQSDTTVHVFEHLLASDSGLNLFIDGRREARWPTVDGWPLWYVQQPLQAGLDMVTFCPLPWQSSVPVSLAEVVLLKEQPTAAQRAAFLEYGAHSWGTSYCGDGVVDPDEACDDGNQRDGDGCRKDCTVIACGRGDSRSCQPACDTTGDCKPAALDLVSVEPSAAYSVSGRLRSLYKGPAFRVRCTSDGSEANVGFAADGQVDRAELSDACGGADGYLTVLYDQSSQGRDLPQPDPNLQPKIYDGAARSMVERQSRPVWTMEEGNRYVWGLDSLELPDNPAVTVALVGRFQDPGPGGNPGNNAMTVRIGIGDTNSTVGSEIALGYGANADFMCCGSGMASWPSQSSAVPHTSVYMHGSGKLIDEATMRVDGQAVSPSTTSNIDTPFHFGLGRVLIGKDWSDDSATTVDFQTAIFWNSVLAGEDVLTVEAGLKATSDPCVIDPAACECPSDTLRTPTTIAGQAKLWTCFDPSASQCEALVHGRAMWDRQEAGRRLLSRTIHTGEHLALVRDRAAKLRAAEADPALMQAICDGDADGDLVPDPLDACPGTADLKATGTDGCELTTLPKAVPDEMVLALLEHMGLIATPACKNAQTPFTPLPVHYVDRDVSAGRYVFLLSSEPPAVTEGCPTFYQFEGTVTRSDGASLFTRFTINTQDARIQTSVSGGVRTTQVVLHVTDDPEFAAWGSDANHISFHVREVNGGGMRSAFSESVDVDITSGL